MTNAEAAPPAELTGRQSVSVFVASLDTAEATELCIRSARSLAGHPFSLHVGDCGSTDGSVEMLRRLAGSGWLTLDVAAGGRYHADWLDHWLATCTDRYAVFVDSDVEFRRANWLRDLVAEAAGSDAALVAGEWLAEVAAFPAPRAGLDPADRAEMLETWFGGHETVRLAGRPAPWLLLVDVVQLRRLGTTFAFLLEQADRPEDVVAFDVGGALFRDVVSAGLTWALMPGPFREAYHHYGGLSWVPLKGRRGLKKRRDLILVKVRLRAARRREGRSDLPGPSTRLTDAVADLRVWTAATLATARGTGRRASIIEAGAGTRFYVDARRRRADREAYRACRTPSDFLDFARDRFPGAFSQIPEEILAFLAFASARAPQTVAEIGTQFGGTNFLLSQALPTVRTMIGVDLLVRNRSRLLTFRRSDQRIVLLNGSSRDSATAARVVAARGGHPLDLLFIDGDHRWEGVAGDFERYRHLVRPGGLVVFHDIVPDDRLRGRSPTTAYAGEVPLLWARLKGLYPSREFVRDPDQEGFGIGVLEYDPAVVVPPGTLVADPAP